MKHSLDHFLREAERCVPHLAPEERRKWAEACHAQHPGVTGEGKTGPLPGGRGSEQVGRARGRVAWKGAVLALLLFCAAREARCQDPAGFNGPVDPAFRNVPLLWVINAPSGTCSGVSIEYAFRSNPPALWGCNQAGGTWTNLGGSVTGSGCIPTGGAGVVQASNGSGACENTSITDNGTTVKITEPLNLPGSTSGNVTIQPQAAAGTPTLTLPTTTGTFAVAASAPLALNATTGNLTCAACLTAAVTSVGTNNGLTGGTVTSTGTLGLASIAAGGMLCNTGTTSQPPTVGNCGVSVPQSGSGTVAISANSPLSLNATTGNLTCATCLTANQTITLSGDLSGNGATAINATVVGVEGASIPASALVLGTNSSRQLTAASLTSGDLWIGNGSNVPQQRAISQDASVTNAGVWTNTGINGASVPASALVLGTNSSSQLTAASLTSGDLWIGNGSNVPAQQAISQDASVTNAGVWTNSGINGEQVGASQAVVGTNASKQLIAASAHGIGTPLQCADTSASGTAQSCSTSPSFTPAAGDAVIYQTTTANTGDVTTNVNSLGAKHIRKWLSASTLAAGDLPANVPVAMIYDGTYWEIMTIGNAPSGGGGSGTVNSGTQGQIAYYATTGTAVSGIGPGTAKQLVLSNGTSGPQFADLPDVKIVPAALCNAGAASPGWTLPSSGAFSAACRGGTNNLLGALQGTPNASGGTVAYFDYELPGDWDTSNQPYVNIFYGSGSNATGTVIFTVSTACMGAEAGGTTDDPSFNANSAFSTQTMATANRAWAVSGQLTTVTSGNNCVAGTNMIVKIALSGTASSAINVYKATITTPRLVTVQAD